MSLNELKINLKLSKINRTMSHGSNLDLSKSRTDFNEFGLNLDLKTFIVM